MATMNKPDDQSNLNNAGDIIDRFGGIRPMAKKLGVAVTTVQGWKKRDVIPAARRKGLLEAAQSHQVDLSGLIDTASVVNENSFEAKIEKAIEQETPAKRKTHEKAIADGLTTQDAATKEKDESWKAQRQAVTSDDLMEQIVVAQKQALRKSLWMVGVLVAVICGAAVILLWPSKQKIELNIDNIAALQSNVEAVREEQSLFKSFVPEEMQGHLSDLKEQAENIQETVIDLGVRAEEIAGMAGEIVGADGGPLSERIARLEEQMGTLELTALPANMAMLMEKLEGLAQSVDGQAQLSGSFAQLQDIVMGLQGQMAPVAADVDVMDIDGDTGGRILPEADLWDGALLAAQQQDTDLGKTLAGVAPDDFKAAALLLGLSQFRQSLHRSAPFEDDLALLQKLLGEDNPELNDAMMALAPKAAEGVLTPEGLSGEFKGLAGDIVVASLKGEDVALKEKALARLHDVMQVEKDGDLLTGTDTQATVARAQKMLDEGDVAGALAELKMLEGEAAQTAQPFINEAEMTLIAQQLQERLGSTIMSRMPTSLPTLALPEMSMENMDLNVRDVVEGVIELRPKRRVISDETGSVNILPNKPIIP